MKLLETKYVKGLKILPKIGAKNSEIPCSLSAEAELLSPKFCNASSIMQCTKYNVNIGTKSTFHHENNSEYTLLAMHIYHFSKHWLSFLN